MVSILFKSRLLKSLSAISFRAVFGLSGTHKSPKKYAKHKSFAHNNHCFPPKHSHVFLKTTDLNGYENAYSLTSCPHTKC